MDVKRSGHGVDHPHSSSAEVKEKVELHFASSSEPSCHFYMPGVAASCGPQVTLTLRKFTCSKGAVKDLLKKGF
jgi:hypothetical protein